MNLDDFESQYREALDVSSNHLQTSVLLLSNLSRLEDNLLNVGKSMQKLSEIVEEFISQQRAE